MDFRQLKDQAHSFRKQKQFEQALSIYERIFVEYPDEFGYWEQIGYCACLRHVGRAEEALNILRELYPKLRAANPPEERLFSWCRNEYGWCVYDTELKNLNWEGKVDENRLFKAAKAITQLTAQEEFSPYERTVFRVVDYLQSKQNPNYGQILYWLDKLDPNLLTAIPTPATSVDARNPTYPSPREDWYAHRSKAFLEVGRYAECVEICTQALTTLDTFHYDRNIWLRWYRAKSLIALNRPAEALADLQEVGKSKTDFFVDHEIARTHFLLNQFDDALSHAVSAALARGGLEFKWEVFLLIGEILEAKNDLDNARKHVCLAAKIRAEQGWSKMPLRLSQSIQRLQVNLNDAPDSKSLKRELLEYWKRIRPLPKTEYSGVVDRIHDNGDCGWVKNDDGRRHYFKIRHFNGSPKDLQSGLRVGFNLIEKMNKKKGVMELNAIDIVAVKP